MAATRLLAASVAAGALLSSVPAIAQAVDFEHVHPVNEEPVVFESAPMVQALPGAAPAATQMIERRVEVVPAPPPPPPHDHGAKGGHDDAHGQHHPMPGYPGYAPAAPWFDRHQFDRSAWLAECRERIRGVNRKDRGGVIGGLLGAVAGGVAGNRLWDSKRLAGTLLGAGVGGLAGAAIGSAIAASGDRDRDRDSYDECADTLDRYLAGGYGGHGYGYPEYGYGYAFGYPAFAYVPVLVQVPQRAIVHETVTEEWVTVPGPARTVAPAKIIRHAPAPTKRTKLIKGR